MVLAVVALALLATSIGWRGRMTTAVLFTLGAEYLTVLLAGRVALVTVIAYAAGLIVLCELLFFAAQLPSTGAVETAVIVGQLVRLALIAAGSAAVAILVVSATALQRPEATYVKIVGVVAAVLLCSLPWLLLLGRRDGR